MNKPILCLDFDGVIHGYESGWKGAGVVPDPPVPGALEFIVEALDTFDVAVFSSRSKSLHGRRAMKRYLRLWLRRTGHYEGPDDYWSIPEWWRRRIERTAFADPWDEEVAFAAREVVRQIKWPWFKPAAFLTIDDRALCFDGTWPDLTELRGFKPWNKRLRSAA